ncbi:MAG: DUF3667 domain-containing protein [Chitinophagaceae bacterium]|nr:MAG: DUF3667 domain-containing protein [Chitinophagaceae bacterium]
MNPAPTNCKNCGNSVTSNYCGECGEKVYSDHDKSFGHIIEEGIHFITHLEGSFPATVKTIFIRPGKFSLDYCNGIRKKYFKPISLFLMVVVIYLIFPLAQGLNLSLDLMISGSRSNGMGWVQQAAEVKAATRGISMEQLAERYDHKSPKFAKIMLFLLLPMAAFLLKILFYKKRRYYFDHFILGTELVTHFILVAFLIIPLSLYLVAVVIQFTTGKIFDYSDSLMGPLIILALIPSWTIALKRFYQEKTGWAILKTVLFLVAFTLLCLFIIYRLIIYFTILLFL